MVGEAIDPVDQDAGEQEIRKHDNAFVAKTRDMLEAGFDQWEGDARIADLTPAKAHAFPEHPGDLGDIGVRIRVRRAAPDDDKASFMARDVRGGDGQCFFDTGGGGGDALLRGDAPEEPISVEYDLPGSCL